MRLYQPKYREKPKDGKRKGRKKQCKTWWIAFRGPDEIVHRWGLETTNIDVADIVKSQIDSLNEWAKKNLDPPDNLVKWVRCQPPKLRDKIYKAGLLKAEHANTTKPLAEHLREYIEYMLLNSKSSHPQQVEMNIERIIKGCGFKFWTDIEGQKVNQFIGRLISDGVIGRNTGNHYATSFKSFAYWMKEQGRIKEVPAIQSVDFDLAERRSFEYKEWSLLLEKTRQGPERHGLSGYERYVLYKLAFDSGLRKKELRNLMPTSLNFKNRTVFLSGKYTKNGKDALQKITPETAALVDEYIKGKMPGMKIFKLPKHTEIMIRKDCKAADIEVENYRGKIQFHSIRHTTASILASQGVPPHVLKKIMRHANIETTMKYYTHLMLGSEDAAIEKLRGLENRDMKEKSA